MKKGQGKGVFGIPIKPVKTKKDLEKLLNPKKNQPKKQRIDGFTFIPGLNLYVADQVSLLEKNWYSCKTALKLKG